MRSLTARNRSAWRQSPGWWTFISLFTAFTALVRPAFGASCAPCTSPAAVQARLPPSLDPAANSSSPANWTGPPPGWIYGMWYITYSSNEGYTHLTNLQYQSAPTIPTCTHPTPAGCGPGTFPGQNIDLQVWNSPNDTSGEQLSAFGFDIPHRTANPTLGPGWDTTFDFRGTGALKDTANTWEMLTWGYDENGDGYFVAYETAVSNGGAGPCLDVESRNPAGPSSLLYGEIRSALQALGNSDLNKLINGLQKLPRTANESTQPFICGPACRNNTDLMM